MKIVLDTNCLLPAIFENSPYYWLWEAFDKGKFSLCCSTEMLEEYEELLKCRLCCLDLLSFENLTGL